MSEECYYIVEDDGDYGVSLSNAGSFADIEHARRVMRDGRHHGTARYRIVKVVEEWRVKVEFDLEVVR